MRQQIFSDISDKVKVLIVATIIALIGGVLISGRISKKIEDRNDRYSKAITVEDPDKFSYCLDTNFGYIFAGGSIKAVDPVTTADIEGEYSSILTLKQRYTMHTMVYTVTSNGRTHTRTTHYWSWDTIDSTEQHCSKAIFLGKEFLYDDFTWPEEELADTVKDKKRSNIRYKYYVLPSEFDCAIFLKANRKVLERDEEESRDRIKLYKDYTALELKDRLITDVSLWLWLFWIGWITIVGGAIFLAYRCWEE